MIRIYTSGRRFQDQTYAPDVGSIPAVLLKQLEDGAMSSEFYAALDAYCLIKRTGDKTFLLVQDGKSLGRPFPADQLDEIIAARGIMVPTIGVRTTSTHLKSDIVIEHEGERYKLYGPGGLPIPQATHEEELAFEYHFLELFLALGIAAQPQDDVPAGDPTNIGTEPVPAKAKPASKPRKAVAKTSGSGATKSGAADRKNPPNPPHKDKSQSPSAATESEKIIDAAEANLGTPQFDFTNLNLGRSKTEKATENGRNFEEAVKLLNEGLCPVPQSPKGKFPAVKWKEFEERRPTFEELEEWHQCRKFAHGLGIITGAISGCVVIDEDGPIGAQVSVDWQEKHGALPITRKHISGSGRGRHTIYKYPGHKITTKGNKGLQLDKKGDGGYCAWPPTLHKSGGRYAVACPAQIMDAPKGYFEYIDGRINAANAADADARKVEKTGSPDAGGQRRSPGSSIANRPKGYINTSDTQPPPEYSISEVTRLNSALAYISPADRDVWRAVGYALQWLVLHGWPENICFKIWDEWASTGAGYSKENQIYQWNSLKSDPNRAPEDSIKGGRIYGLAMDAGWKNGGEP